MDVFSDYLSCVGGLTRITFVQIGFHHVFDADSIFYWILT